MRKISRHQRQMTYKTVDHFKVCVEVPILIDCRRKRSVKRILVLVFIDTVVFSVIFRLRYTHSVYQYNGEDYIIRYTRLSGSGDQNARSLGRRGLG